MSEPQMPDGNEQIITVDQVVASVREQAAIYAAAQLQPHHRSKAFMLSPAALQEVLTAAWIAGHAAAVKDLQEAIKQAVNVGLKKRDEARDHETADWSYTWICPKCGNRWPTTQGKCSHDGTTAPPLTPVEIAGDWKMRGL